MINEFYVCDALVRRVSGEIQLTSMPVNSNVTLIEKFDRMDQLIDYCLNFKIHIIEFSE